MRRRMMFLKDTRGAALLEFVFCFPILFVLFLFAIQFAYIMITWQVVHYSAYMGARSAMTVNNLQRKSRAETINEYAKKYGVQPDRVKDIVYKYVPDGILQNASDVAFNSILCELKDESNVT